MFEIIQELELCMGAERAINSPFFFFIALRMMEMSLWGSEIVEFKIVKSSKIWDDPTFWTFAWGRERFKVWRSPSKRLKVCRRLLASSSEVECLGGRHRVCVVFGALALLWTEKWRGIRVCSQRYALRSVTLLRASRIRVSSVPETNSGAYQH